VRTRLFPNRREGGQVITRPEAEAIYDVGRETVVRVLMALSQRVDQLSADFAVLKAD